MPVEKFSGGVEIVDWLWMQQIDPIRLRRVTHTTLVLSRIQWWRTLGFKVVTEGLSADLFTKPTLVVQNHTHKLDWLPVRSELKLHVNREMSSWIKLRGFNEGAIQRWFLANSGNIPISSRGYVIIADHLELFGKRPSEEEYRLLRKHVDEGEPLPQNTWAWKIQNTPRRMLGWGFVPEVTPYAQAVRSLYMDMMSTSLSLARRSLSEGYMMHLYPEGTISSRLCPGKTGALQVAIALGLQIVPVGVSGMREAFDGLMAAKDGRVTIRFGEPWQIPQGRYDEHVPFDLDSERRFNTELAQDTQEIMERINDLLEPDYQWMPDLRPDGKSGIFRFVT
ncbi:MAG: 1-acyl-sn-glycerol-3-phosphate acyltransferase [Myxococcota bacterium]|nr:1-acyl-sn-glycerol-3-phosphate acyltransferase [Myxococcota bacterium]